MDEKNTLLGRTSSKKRREVLYVLVGAHENSKIVMKARHSYVMSRSSQPLSCGKNNVEQKRIAVGKGTVLLQPAKAMISG